MSGYEQFNFDYGSIQRQYQDNNDSVFAQDNTTNSSNQYTQSAPYVPSQYAPSYAYGRAMQGNTQSYDSIDSYDHSYMYQTQPSSQYTSPYAYGGVTQSSLQNDVNINSYGNAYGNAYGKSYTQQSLSRGPSTASSAYSTMIKDSVPNYGNRDPSGSPFLGRNYTRAAPSLSTSNYSTPRGDNAYLQPANVYIPALPTQHHPTVGREESSKQRNRPSNVKRALAPAQGTKEPSRKRAKPSNEHDGSSEDSVGQGPSGKRRKVTKDHESGEPSEKKDEEPNDQEAKESKKRIGRENQFGKTSLINGALHWSDPETGKWLPAVTHHDIRHLLIAQAQRLHPGQAYDHPDSNGGLLYNETSFMIEQKPWGPHRNDRPAWGFQWKPTARLPGPSPPRPGFMKYKGKIVLDPTDQPIIDHKNIPLTLSSEIPGCKMQWMKMQNPDITQVDFWARMPRMIPKSRRQAGTKPLSGINTIVNMHMMRFREKQGVLSWSEREGSTSIEENLIRFFAYNGFDPVNSGNSTMDFGRDLDSWESELVKLTNLGKFTSRGGKNALTDWGRYKNNVLKMQRIEAKDEALYLAVMGKLSPELDLTLDPEYNPNADLQGTILKNNGTRGGTTRQRRPRGKRQSRPEAKKTVDTDTEDEFEDDTEEEDEDDDDPVIFCGRRRSTRGNKTTKDAGVKDQNTFPSKDVDSAEEEDLDDVYSLSTRHTQRPVHQYERRQHKALDTERQPRMFDHGHPYIHEKMQGMGHGSTLHGSGSRKLQITDPKQPILSPNVAIGATGPVMGMRSAEDRSTRQKRAREAPSEDDVADDQPPAKRLRFAEDGTTEEWEDEAKESEDPLSSSKTEAAKKAWRDIHRGPRLPQPALGWPPQRPQQHPGDVLAEQVAIIRATASSAIDFTTVEPRNEGEMTSLDEALQLTRDGYVELAGTAAPLTDRRDSYADQWQYIFKSFALDWVMWNMEFNQTPPQLFRLTPESWGQSLMDWKYVENAMDPTESNEEQLAPEGGGPDIAETEFT